MSLVALLAAVAVHAVDANMEVAYRELWDRFVSPEGILYDYIGEIPTPKDCEECRPNAMGWWSPIENGPMFTGPFLWAMVHRAKRTGCVEDREKCCRLAQGLLLCSEVCGTAGMICRGVGSDRRCHYPLGSDDQTFPWFFGLDAFLRSGFGDAALRERVRSAIVRVASALEARDWDLPCDGKFAKDHRGNPKRDELPYRGAVHYLFILKAAADASGDAKWKNAYLAARDEKYPGGYEETRLDVCAYGYRFDQERSKHKLNVEPGLFWIYVTTHEAAWELAEREGEPRAAKCFREGVLNGGAWASRFVETYRGWDNRAERPFRYANWRTGWKWREQSICSFSPEYRQLVEGAIVHYDYTTPNISEFFFATVAYEVMSMGR